MPDTRFVIDMNGVFTLVVVDGDSRRIEGTRATNQ